MEPVEIRKILVANRGEIAVRILRACREMGISAVAVYSQADEHALHVRRASEAIELGPAAPSESYLHAARILQAARQSGAQAIHPGYGFLSENAAFARAVVQAGLVFIGPGAAAIEAMGDKARAREQMQAAGVPVVPGHHGAADDQSLAEAARRIGFPILVKAAAGGGGKGMRIAHDEGELDEALAAARREAEHAFGDDRLILEKYIRGARHVEIQILADAHGNTIHLNERECSIQRRHQKIIEEAPSPLLDSELRARMGSAAVAAAQAVGYTGAGTVEFIVDPEEGAYYFLEMNTRLQVEHPVTEMTTGLDLVQLQIQLASAQPLPAALRAARPPLGHAIECRLYAEDPANQFLPAAGPVLRFRPPEGPGIRVDSGVESGDQVTTHYDPLLAKIIVHAADRDSAIRRMQAALRDTVLLGLTSNLEFLQDILRHPAFQRGLTTTGFIEEHMADWQPGSDLPIEVLVAAALASRAAPAGRHGRPEAAPDSPWQTLLDFRLGRPST